MKDVADNPAELWRTVASSLKTEVASLSAAERGWISPRLERIASTQERMHRLFLEAGGAEACRECGGECCHFGKNHVTLANILPFFLEGEEPPEPEFGRPCPYGGPEGCFYGAARRPFNCVTFLCDRVEDALSSAVRSEFYALERELRQLYLEFDGRYAGSTLRGILIRAPRLEGRPFLARP